MKKVLTVILVMFIAGIASAQYQAITDYYYQNDFLMASSGAFYDGLAGFDNPANLSFLKAGELRFNWSTEGTKAGTFQDWGLFMAMPNVGFGMVRRDTWLGKATDYRISLGFGGDKVAVGAAYGWSTHTIDALAAEEIFKSSIIVRPWRYLSVGLMGDFSFESDARQGVAEIGLRPLGDSRLTLFGDIAMKNKTEFDDAPWSAGAVVECARGINLTGRYFENETFTVGLLINFGHGSIAQQMHYDEDQEYAYNTYSVRVGGARPSIFPSLIDKDRRYLKIYPKGQVSYLGYLFSGEKDNRFLEILENIKAAGDDPRIAVIALNLSDISIAPEHAWEIREALKEAKSKGKQVVTFIETADLRQYYLASVGDMVVMDPNGMIMMTGISMGKTYFKGTLEKLGLGFDEWRFYKYKSAAEVFSREDMSDADQEQYQAFVDDMYEFLRQDISQSRGMKTDKFDLLIDEQALFLPSVAIESGLVDTTGRWTDVDKIVKKLENKKLYAISGEELYANALPPKYWGGDPQIALVYGLGECALETGIKARWLEKQFKNLAKDNSVKAVVFRVDSPGGDALASDIVAEALKECAAKKPVIVSQGQVAGSGGYWISMYGDKIIAGPTTITGSIGVIGGWLWDKGLSDKLGLTSDFVTRGKHADIGTGVRLPILGMTVPSRNLDEDERAKVESMIREFYDDFVGKVAAGRKMSVDEVKEIAEGHFYSGVDGKEIGLVDELGGVMMAIEIAKEQARIAKDQRVELKEIPHYLGLFAFENPYSSMIGIKTGIDTEDPAIQYIKMLNDSPLKAMPMLQPGTYPTAE